MITLCNRHHIVTIISIVLLCLWAFALPCNAQQHILQQFDSIKAVVNSEHFNENWKPIINSLERLKTECLASDKLFIKSSFLDYYASALYNDDQYAKCIPYVKQYIDIIEKDGWGDKSCEFLAAYNSLADSYYHLHQLDEAEKALRHAIIYYSDQLDSCVVGYALYDLLLEIAKSKSDTALIPQIHQAKQSCFINYLAITDPTEQDIKYKKDFEDLTDSIQYAQKNHDIISTYIYRGQLAELLQKNGWYEEAEYEYNALINDVLKNKAYKGEKLIKRYTQNLAWTLNQDAVSLIGENELKKAEVQLQKALQLSSQFETDKQLLESVYHNLGRIEMLKGDYKSALKMLNKSALLQKQNHGNVINKTQEYIDECQKHL